jgi:hypothetical protein
MHLLQFLDEDFNTQSAKWSASCKSSFCFWVQLARFCNRDRVLFGAISGGFFVLLTAGFYYL